MFKRLATILITASLLLRGFAYAHNPVDFLEVIAVDPANPIEHGVELKTSLDTKRLETQLVGPEYFSNSVGCLNRPLKKDASYLSWYRIAGETNAAAAKANLEVSVIDMVRGFDNKALRIVGSAEFLLSPSQVISSGVPDPVPAGLDHYKAYRIVEPPSLHLEADIVGADESTRRQLTRPLYLCVATEQWHHHEHVAASHPKDCFVVYQLDHRDHVRTYNTLDQFGLNHLRSSKSQWLCVRAALLTQPAQLGQ